MADARGGDRMAGPIVAFLEADHARLDALLTRACSEDLSMALPAYVSFREGLLRHIAMEEKVLLPDARRRRGGEPLAIAKQLRADHAALGALLVPTPTPEILATVRGLLAEHNALEEGPGGLCEVCERLAGEEIDALLSRLSALPEVPVAPHFDGPRALASIQNLLKARAGGPRPPSG